MLLFLKDLKGFDPDHDRRQTRTESTAEKILTYYARKTDNGLSLEVIKAFCRVGKAVFMLDGLDEIDSDLREVAVNALAAFDPPDNQDEFRRYMDQLPADIHVGSRVQHRTYHEWQYHPEKGRDRPEDLARIFQAPFDQSDQSGTGGISATSGILSL